VAVTGPGDLPCKYIIHAVGPIYRGNKSDDEELISSVYESLKKAHELKLTSISIPAISSGIFGFPKKRCARLLIDTTLKFCRYHHKSNLKEIRFTNYDKETVDIFNAEFDITFANKKI